ncbi:MAG: hypothetical protein JSS14_30615 [Proteobacteria bacterium]|nr:hypothetical protein [Pseudomonadota bacterium]
MENHRTDRHRFEDWDVFIYLGWDVLERTFVGRAELYLNDAFRARIGLNRDFATTDDAAAFLKRSSQSFIEDWKQREHSTDSEFSEL